MAIRALIFDFDGLIVDTELPEYSAWEIIYQRHQQTLPLSLWAKVLGASYMAFDPADHLQQQLSYPLDRDEVYRLHHEMADHQIEALQPLPGVREMIASAAKSGLRLGIASSSHREWVAGKLERYGLLRYFDAVWTASEVQHAKPAPDLYLRCVEELDICPDEAVALEDSPNGVTAAKTAGLYCVAVPNFVSSQLPLDHADWIVPSLADIQLKDILERFNGSNGKFRS